MMDPTLREIYERCAENDLAYERLQQRLQKCENELKTRTSDSAGLVFKVHEPPAPSTEHKGNGSAETMPAVSPAAMVALPKALREAGGYVISELRREWKRDQALYEAQADAILAKLRADYNELQLEIERQKQVIKDTRRDVA
jgi:hypothetical protein